MAKPLTFLEIDKLKEVLSPELIVEGEFIADKPDHFRVKLNGSHDLLINRDTFKDGLDVFVFGKKSSTLKPNDIIRRMVRALWWEGCFPSFQNTHPRLKVLGMLDSSLTDFSWPKDSESSAWEKTLDALIIQTSKLEYVPLQPWYLNVLRALKSVWSDLTPSGRNRVKSLICTIIKLLRDQDSITQVKKVGSWFKVSSRFDATLDELVRHINRHPSWKGLVINHLLDIHVLSDTESEPDVTAFLLNEVEQITLEMKAVGSSDNEIANAIGWFVQMRPEGAKRAKEQALFAAAKFKKQQDLLDTSLAMLTKEKEDLQAIRTKMEENLRLKDSTIKSLKEKIREIKKAKADKASAKDSWFSNFLNNLKGWFKLPALFKLW